MSYYFLILIVVTIILIYKLVLFNTKLYEDYLYGFWIADSDDFCEQSDIESMMLFIGEPNDDNMYLRTRNRSCYIVITNNLCNQSFTISYRPAWIGLSSSPYKFTAKIQFEGDMIWPEYITVDIDICNGTIVIYDENTIYAKLTKHHDITNTAHADIDCDFV